MAYTDINAILGYIQMSDLIALTDDSGSGQLDNGILNTVIQNASDTIDAAIGNIYQVPITTVVSPIPSWATTIACFLLYRRRLNPQETNNFRQAYEMVMNQLEQVNKGEYHLNLATLRDFSQVAYNAVNTPYGAVGTNWPVNSL